MSKGVVVVVSVEADGVNDIGGGRALVQSPLGVYCLHIWPKVVIEHTPAMDPWYLISSSQLHRMPLRVETCSFLKKRKILEYNEFVSSGGRGAW